MNAVRQRALLAWLCCLCGALAACLWIRTGAPVESFARIECAAAQGAVVATDRGHAHDPAREPPGTPIEASESEEQCPEDGETQGESLLDLQGANHPILPMLRSDDRAAPRDPCTRQCNSRGPPAA